MSVIIRDQTNGLDFEIPFEFIANRKNSTYAHQICEFYLQGNGECTYGCACKKLHINRDYFQNHIAQKIIQHMEQKNNGQENKNGHDDIYEYNQKKSIEFLEKRNNNNNMEEKDEKCVKKQKMNHRAHVSFSIRMDVQERYDHHCHSRKQRNDDFLNQKNRYHPFLNYAHNGNQNNRKKLEKSSYHKYESNNNNDNNDKKICIYKRGEPCDDNEILMEVKYNTLLPTKGRDIALNDQDGTYRLQICKFFQRGHGCLDGKNCFFAHLDL